MDINIYLDDRRRPALDDSYRIVDNYADFLALIDTYSKCLGTLDLDYDLGWDSMWTGLDALKYMKKHNIKCRHINVHSTHPSGRDMMLYYARTNFPDIEISGNADDW